MGFLWFLLAVAVLAGFYFAMYHFAGWLFTKWYSEPQEALGEILDTGEIPAAWVFAAMKRHKRAMRLGAWAGRVSLWRSKRKVLRRTRILIRDVRNTSAITDEFDRSRQLKELQAARAEWRKREAFWGEHMGL